MEVFIPKNFENYVTLVNDLVKAVKFRSDNPAEFVFRGQNGDFALLPAVARNKPSIKTDVERQILQEFKRKAKGLFPLEHLKDNDGSWLIYAQHYGVKTRLLDWTRNPLNALWFSLDDNFKEPSFVYGFSVTEENIATEDDDPFNNKKQTRLIKPSLNNRRIVAQDGWFTIHVYSYKDKKFVPLEQNNELKDQLFKIKVTPELKSEAALSLDVMGINHFTLFPDLEGVSKQVNWEFAEQLGF